MCPSFSTQNTLNLASKERNPSLAKKKEERSGFWSLADGRFLEPMQPGPWAAQPAMGSEWAAAPSFFFFFYNFILFCLFGLRLLPENRQSRVLCSLFFLEPSHLQQSSATAFPDQWAFLPINMYRPPGDFKSVRSPFSYGTHARTTATSKTLCWIQHLVLYKRVHFH